MEPDGTEGCVRGANGSPGPAGATGAIGQQGPAGVPGVPGANPDPAGASSGTPGLPGEIGPQGPAGAAGVSGPGAPNRQVIGQITIDSVGSGPIQILSFDWGLSSTASIGSASGGAGAGKTVFKSFTFAKAVDKNTPGFLLSGGATGRAFSDGCKDRSLRVRGTRRHG